MAFHEAVQAVITVCTMKCIENDRARSERRRLAVSPYLAHPVLTNPQWRLWTLVRPAGPDNGPLLSGAGLPSDPPLSKKRTWKRAENPPQTASVDDLRSRDFASSLLQVNLFFSFFLSSLPRQQPAPPRAIVREATSKFFANGPLMAGYACVVFSNEPVGVVSSLITRITSTGKPSVRTRETTPFPSTTARPYSSPLCTLELARYRRVLAASLNARQTEERIAIVSRHFVGITCLRIRCNACYAANRSRYTVYAISKL